jgi:hypothetical protein
MHHHYRYLGSGSDAPPFIYITRISTQTFLLSLLENINIIKLLYNKHIKMLIIIICRDAPSSTLSCVHITTRRS